MHEQDLFLELNWNIRAHTTVSPRSAMNHDTSRCDNTHVHYLNEKSQQ